MTQSVFNLIQRWPVDHASAAIIDSTGILESYGTIHRPFPLASVTKMLVGRACQVAIDEGAYNLDTPAGPPGSTVAHLLSHASGVSMHSSHTLARPGTRRIYSNYGFSLLAYTLEQHTDIPWDNYFTQAILEPLQMTQTSYDGGIPAAGYGITSTVEDLTKFMADLLVPTVVSQPMHEQACIVHFPGLSGVLPGYGVQRPNDWGLGFEIRAHKHPHWTGTKNSPSTFGHFGQSGTFLWIDPEAQLGLVVLTDRPFGTWAHSLWPQLSDAVLEHYRPSPQRQLPT